MPDMDALAKGNLRDCSLPEVLLSLKRKGSTGTLTVTTANFRKNVYFQKGNAIFATSSLEDERFGEMLVKAGKINLRQYEESVEVLKKTGKRQGAILVELGYITPKDLFQGVKYQVKEIIYSLFQLEEGAYEFAEEDLPSNEVITLKISTENLIYEGVRRIDNLTRIKRELPGSGVVLRIGEEYVNRPVQELDIIDLSAEDRRMLFLIDGRKTIGRLIGEAKSNSFEAMKTLYVLLAVGIAVKAKEAGPGKASGEGLPAANEAPREDRTIPVEETRGAFLKEQFQKGIEEFKRGDFPGAVERFTRITREDPGNAKAWSNLSLVLSKFPDRLKEAEEALLHVIHLDPSSGEHLANLGLLYLKAGLKARARRQFEKALSLDPANVKAISGLARTE